MQVREATVEDMEAVTAIYGFSVRNETASFELEPPDVATMTDRWQSTRDAGYPYLVACDDAGCVIGYAYASAYRPRAAYAGSVENSVYVSPDHRRKGVARRLLEGLIAACQTCGYRQMIAVISDPRNSGSIGLHKALGFRSVGTLTGVGRKFDEWIDVVLMQKVL